MNTLEIFQLALGLQRPWQVVNVYFKEVETTKVKELHIEIGYDNKASKFPVHDKLEREWRHLNFFEHTCYLHCKVPRIKQPDGKIKSLEVPWARPGSGFTLLFEALSMALIEKEMPVNKVADLLEEYPQRIWTIFNYWISIAYDADDQSSVEQIGIDETSTRKGHDYITVAADMKEKRVIHATPGKDSQTIGRIKSHLESKGCPANQIQTACIDMSTGFIAGMQTYFPDTDIVFDRFHVVKMLNEVMDEVRKRELKVHEILKGHKYLFLKNNKNLTARQKQDREQLIELLPTIGEAYRLKLLFNDFWTFKNKDEAAGFLAYWCDLVQESGIYPFIKFTNTLKSHWSGLINFAESKISNGVMEGINNKIQLAKRRARGYKNSTNFINMIYFLAGKLKFNYPQNFI